MKINLPFRPVNIHIEDKFDFSQSLYYFIWSEMGVLTILWASLTMLLPHLSRIWLTFYLPTMSASLVSHTLNQRGKQRYAIMVLLFSGWIVLTLLAVLYWRILPPDNNRYILIVVTAGLLLGKKEGILAATVCAITEIALAFLVKDGSIPSSMPGLALDTLLPHLFFLYLSALVPIVVTQRVRAALQHAQDELTERRRADEMSAENEKRFMDIIESSPDAIFIHKRGNFLYLNETALKFVGGNSADRLLGKSILEIVHPDYRELVATTYEQTKKTGSFSQVREGKMIRLDGSVADVEASSVPITFRGTPAIQTVVRDVTELRHLQQQMHLQIAALNSAANGIIITDRNGTIVWANSSFESLTGYNHSETVGRNPRDLVKSGKQPAKFYKDLWETILSGKVWHGELTNRRKDGSLYIEYMTINPVLDNQGAITHYVAVKQDITSRKLLEEQLLQSKKLEGIGQLAGGIAHDFNNLLNVVSGYAELVKRKLTKGDPTERPLDAILSAARRGADLTKQLLAFAQEDKVSPRILNLNYAIEAISNLLQRILGEHIRLAFLPAKNLWNVVIDPAQFNQIMVNLASNSRDAIKESGTIRITTSNLIAGKDFVASRSDLKVGDYVKIVFEDNGKGMDAETLGRVFEPFFSTKPKAHGAGLGLSTIYGIMKQSGGAVEVTSRPGEGTTVTLYLPRSEGETPGTETLPADDDLIGNETILIVEDQADLLDLAKTTLENYGYTVMASLDPADADLLATSYTGEIHLLLTDVVMPKMGGVELSRRIMAKRPQIKTLYMTGYSYASLAEDSVTEKVDEIIQKPFHLQELVKRVRQIIDS